MKIWIISGWVHLVVGFALGWVVLERPQWISALVAKAKAKLGFGA